MNTVILFQYLKYNEANLYHDELDTAAFEVRSSMPLRRLCVNIFVVTPFAIALVFALILVISPFA